MDRKMEPPLPPFPFPPGPSSPSPYHGPAQPALLPLSRAPRRPFLAVVALALAAGLVLGALVLYGVVLHPTVTITAYWYEWSTPPSVLCDGWGANTPAVPVTVAAGAQFTLSWTNGCWNDTGTYTIDRIASKTTGFTVVSSNLPVAVASTNVWHINVTVASPHSFYYGELALEIQAHAN